MKKLFLLFGFLFLLFAYGNVVGANTTCSEMMACTPLCEINNLSQNCAQYCFNQSSAEARQDMFNFIKCSERYCSDIQDSTAQMLCSYDLCPTETKRCFGLNNASLKNCKDTGDFIDACIAKHHNRQACNSLAIAKSSRNAFLEAGNLLKCVADHCSGLSATDSVFCVKKYCPEEAKKCGMTLDNGENLHEEKKTKEHDKVSQGLQWSSHSLDIMTWNEAISYCRNLNEDGYSDWRLPNIDELRTLVINRQTALGEACKVSEKKGCLSSKCQNIEACAEAYGFGKLEKYADGRYSKLGDSAAMWSSSSVSDKSYSAWIIFFASGAVIYDSKESGYFIRCVR